MSITIDTSKCTGCGKCIRVCPGTLLYKDKNGKAESRYPRDCWGCTACLKECLYGAVSYFLGADIGGMGSTLHTKRDGHFLHWHIAGAEGEERVITINQKESNKY
ncbi:dissimilatory adenylylsulfate reductase beta subunit [Anaerobacterium chartisolvens]|uniref:Dissimilatory adenylylsulfate reductase beta subunit n=1 Tax=Anaerobacterium chartisolvens TaxID=1297424 RepID=A0A369B6X1_9FIRM|nr:ferredoxin family protein [Anaerobacterium chartisolvens]RCX17253.1 dissimilatory adenylylsulfate reductase beta subunit [Anaerobacterium chartisolvens]